MRGFAARAFGLARAFLLLEDPELDARAAGQPLELADVRTHPHRQPLQPESRLRRPGAGFAPSHACASPTRPEPRRHPQRSRAAAA